MALPPALLVAAALAAYRRMNGDGTDSVGANTLVPNGTATFVAGRLNQTADLANPPPTLGAPVISSCRLVGAALLLCGAGIAIPIRRRRTV